LFVRKKCSPYFDRFVHLMDPWTLNFHVLGQLSQ